MFQLRLSSIIERRLRGSGGLTAERSASGVYRQLRICDGS
jgi:hypothetical protein